MQCKLELPVSKGHWLNKCFFFYPSIFRPGSSMFCWQSHLAISYQSCHELREKNPRIIWFFFAVLTLCIEQNTCDICAPGNILIFFAFFQVEWKYCFLRAAPFIWMQGFINASFTLITRCRAVEEVLEEFSQDDHWACTYSNARVVLKANHNQWFWCVTQYRIMRLMTAKAWRLVSDIQI